MADSKGVDDPKKLAVWLTTPNHIFVEIAKDLGYSKFLLDIEHGLFDLEPTDRLIAFIKALGCEVYAKEIADALAADLQPLARSGLITRLSKYDTNPANNPQPPKHPRD